MFTFKRQKSDAPLAAAGNGDLMLAARQLDYVVGGGVVHPADDNGAPWCGTRPPGTPKPLP